MSHRRGRLWYRCFRENPRKDGLRLDMIYWSPLLHFYQPSFQLYAVMEKVVRESYRPLIEVIRRHPHARVTVNINAVTTELLHETGHDDVIQGLRELAERKQIEFTGSGKYHPILPLIPPDERMRQVRRNHLTNRHFFGEVYAPHGFFPPEMAFDTDTVDPVIANRYEWIILGGVACPLAWPVDVVHEASRNDDRLAVFFRDDILSNRISFQDIDSKRFVDHLKGMKREEGDVYVITAMDAETFGHHIQDWEKRFLDNVFLALETGSAPNPRRKAAEHPPAVAEHKAEPAGNIRTALVSDLLKFFPRGKVIQPKASSWSTSEQDIRAENYFPLWKDKANPLHTLQWEHLSVAMELCNRAQDLADNAAARRFAEVARGVLDTALQSDQFWWANKGSRWDINIVHRGLLQQAEVILNAYKAISLSACSDAQKRLYYYRIVVARDLRNKIVDKLILE